MTTVVRVMVGQTGHRFFDGRQTGRRPSAATTAVVIVMVVCQRGRRRGRVLFATVVPGHARDGRVPFGGQRGGRRTSARLGGVHLVTRPVAAHGQRLPIVLLLVVMVLLLVVLMLRLVRVAQRGAAVRRGGGRYPASGGSAGCARRWPVAADFRWTYVGWRFAGSGAVAARFRRPAARR